MTTTHELFKHFAGRQTHYCVLPYGRSFDEYVEMFSLTPRDKTRRILGVADGPASFNATASTRGWRVTSLDPIYQFPARTIRDRFYAVVDRMLEIAWVSKPWLAQRYRSREALRAYREQVLEAFAADFEARPNRYVAGALPTLPFQNRAFDLALCSYLLFVYTSALDLSYHLRAISEMLRVAGEVRLFPVTPTSPHLEAVRRYFLDAGCSVELTVAGTATCRDEGAQLSIRHPETGGEEGTDAIAL
jgi:hypothetical protein